MKACVLSDIHLSWDSLEMPEADYCIIAGDALNTGKISELVSFNSWLGKIKNRYKQIFFCPGNHDICCEVDPDLSLNIMSNAKMIVEGEEDLEGKRVYFCSYVPTFYDWAFMRSERDLESRYYSKIPEGLDLYVGHGPPMYVLDENKKGDHCGGVSLRHKLLSLAQPPKKAVWGHIHPTDDQPTQITWAGIECYNVAIMDDWYSPVHSPIVIDI